MSREHYVSCNDSDNNGCKILPERALLWAILERALEDLDLRQPEFIGEVRSAVSWFRGNELTAFTFVRIVEELELGCYILRRISEKVDEAEGYTDKEAKAAYDKWKAEGKKGRVRGCSLSSRAWVCQCPTHTAVRRDWGNLRRIG